MYYLNCTNKNTQSWLKKRKATDKWHGISNVESKQLIVLKYILSKLYFKLKRNKNISTSSTWYSLP